MDSYRFFAPSLLNEAAIIASDNGAMCAYLLAAPDSPPAQLQALTRNIHDAGWQYVPFTLDNGASVLEVRGFHNKDQLLSLLKQEKACIGKVQHIKGEKESSSLWQFVQKRTLQISGGLYGFGDVNFIRYGMKEGHPEDVAGGVLYALGTLALILFGQNNQADLQVREKAQALEQFLMKENVRIPSTCALHHTAENPHQGVMAKAYDWARSHPAELFNTIYIGAGAMIATAALRHKILKPRLGESRQDKSQRLAAGVMDLCLGLTTSGVSLLGNLIEEKKRDPDDPPPRGWWEKIKVWVQEKPLRLTGYGLMASTMCHAGSTFVEYKKAKRLNDLKTLSAVGNRALFVGSNILAELLVAISSKGHGEGVTIDDSVKNSVYAHAAELIFQQPAPHREMYIQRIATFLQQPDILAESYADVEKELRTQVAQLDKNPWVCKDTPLPALTPPAPAQPFAPNVPAPQMHIGSVNPHQPLQALTAQGAG